MFLPPNKLPENSLNFIQRELEDITSRSSEQKDNVKLKSFGFFTIATKSEVQDLLDSILMIAYPYISQARKLTDMNKQLVYSRSGTGLQFRLLHKALPEGYEDRTQVIIGFQTNEDGIKTVLKVDVWKDDTHVYYEHKGAWFYKIIISESEPVDMEDAESGHPGPFTLSATGGAREKWPGRQGDYTITGEEHRGRPVYSDSAGGFLYTLESGAVGVSDWLGSSYPVMRSTTPAPCPVLCQHWEYLDLDGNKYKPGDITVTFKK